jgi:hypothetical protein
VLNVLTCSRADVLTCSRADALQGGVQEAELQNRLASLAQSWGPAVGDGPRFARFARGSLDLRVVHSILARFLFLPAFLPLFGNTVLSDLAVVSGAPPYTVNTAHTVVVEVQVGRR